MAFTLEDVDCPFNLDKHLVGVKITVALVAGLEDQARLTEKINRISGWRY